MGRKKLVMEKIKDPISRQQFFSKNKDSMVQKADDLAVLCDTDVALLMFSPTGQVTSYSSRGSVEDTMLHIMNHPRELTRGSIPNDQHLMQSLIQSRNEGEMVQKIAIAEAHEKKLNKVNQTLSEVQQKTRCYIPQVENISSVQEADACVQFLKSSVKQVQQSQAKFFGGGGFLQSNENVGVPSVNTGDATAAGTSRAWK